MKEKYKIEIKVNELRDIVYGDSDEFKIVSHETTGHWRHGSEEETIVQRISDGKYFAIYWRDSVKDGCEFQDINDDMECYEVFPEVVTKTIYK